MRIKIIDNKKILGIINEIEETDPRAAAIMMGAFLDNWLGLALLKRTYILDLAARIWDICSHRSKPCP